LHRAQNDTPDNICAETAKLIKTIDTVTPPAHVLRPALLAPRQNILLGGRGPAIDLPPWHYGLRLRRSGAVRGGPVGR
jgi:hypothetical protein